MIVKPLPEAPEQGPLVMSAEFLTHTGSRYGRLGRYEVLAHIATGGVCAVYKAVDADLGRIVALKVLPPAVASQPCVLDRFRREARHAAKLRHDHIVSIYEFGEINGTYFLALEFIEGTDLASYIHQKQQLDPRESLVLVTQAARALEHLHRYRIIHRDIKPGNLLLALGGEQPLLKLTDLGMARLDSDEEFRITRDGYTVGTVDYMAPEQARDSGKADIRSDIYSLGCTWYHMLTSRPPFASGGLAERLSKHQREEAADPRLTNPRVPLEMVRVVRRMLAKKPRDRYQTPTDLLQDLAELEDTMRSGTVGRPCDNAETVGRPRHNTGGTSGRRDMVDRPSPSGEVPPARRPEQKGTQELRLTNTPSAVLPSPSPEQRQAAEGQLKRAREVLALGNLDYAIHLLLYCCKLDPACLEYRRLLRRTERAKDKSQPGKRPGFLANSAARTKLKAVKAARDYLKVLEYGEEILVHNPWDVATHVDMAEAAEALGLLDVSAWLLEQALQKESPDATVSRALARLYERQGDLAHAIKFWEMVRRADPSDIEASRKPRDLAARETMARVGQL
jgi:serine/threonine protein kinase